jgi:hypothetical protein
MRKVLCAESLWNNESWGDRVRDIMRAAGELDDRWPGCASGRAGGKSGHHFARAE